MTHDQTQHSGFHGKATFLRDGVGTPGFDANAYWGVYSFFPPANFTSLFQTLPLFFFSCISLNPGSPPQPCPCSPCPSRGWAG